MSMGEILEVLLSKARVEAEDAQRVLLGALNGLAALMLLEPGPHQTPMAVQTYRQVSVVPLHALLSHHCMPLFRTAACRSFAPLHAALSHRCMPLFRTAACHSVKPLHATLCHTAACHSVSHRCMPLCVKPLHATLCHSAACRSVSNRCMLLCVTLLHAALCHTAACRSVNAGPWCCLFRLMAGVAHVCSKWLSCRHASVLGLRWFQCMWHPNL